MTSWITATGGRTTAYRSPIATGVGGKTVPPANTSSSVKGATGGKGDSVAISPMALAAQQSAADNKKDFKELAKEVRSSLDEQARNGKSAADLSKLSGRALSAIALNEGNSFSETEVSSAKSMLREQTRTRFAAAIGTSRGGISAYGGQLMSKLVADLDAVSPEEQRARGWTPKLHEAAAGLASISSTTLVDLVCGLKAH